MIRAWYVSSSWRLYWRRALDGSGGERLAILLAFGGKLPARPS
jgi:hypothetical protein